MLFLVLTYCFRSTQLGYSFGYVSSSLPILVDKKLAERYQGEVDTIQDSTLTLVLTEKALFFGELSSFAENFYLPQKKYKITHENGSPQLDKFLFQLKKWKNKSDLKSDPLIFVVEGSVPVGLTIKSIDVLKPIFSNVILASGIR